MTQLYWQIFKNLEKEFLGLSETIYIDDFQQSVYSMKIADLLIRTVIEIEALSKELYLENSGKPVEDEEMYFDTVCINYLNNLWRLENKIVLVVSPNLYYDKEENKVLRPLHKAMKRGTSSSDWNKAYQAVKHNRVKELHKGNIKNLLHGLAALYILNLYYKNDKIENILEIDRLAINGSWGSDLFSVKIHRIEGLSLDGTYIKKTDYDECVYLEDYETSSKEKAIDALNTLAEFKKINIYETNQSQIIYNKLYNQTTDSMNNLHYNILLNKHQY